MSPVIDGFIEPALWLLADWSLRWAVLIGGLVVGLLVWRPRRAAARHLVCWAVLLAGLLLPVLPRWGPGFGAARSTATVAEQPTPTPHHPTARAMVDSPLDPPDLSPSPPVEAKPTTGSRPVAPTPVASAESPEAPPPPFIEPAEESLGTRRIGVLCLAGLWLAGVTVYLARWVLGWVLLRSLRRSAVEIGGAPAALLAACRAELRLHRSVALASHPRVQSPVTLGLLRPVILVPPSWAHLSEPDQRGSLLHELAHVARHDDWLALLLELVRAVFFFHPLVRWLLARLERERELLCDETAIRHGIDPRQYVRMLLAFAHQPGRLALVGSSYPLRFGQRRTVKSRIHHLLEENMDRWITPLSVGRGLALGAAVVVLAACLGSFRVQALETDEPPAASGPQSSPTETSSDKPHGERQKPPRRVKLPTRVAPYQVLKIEGTGLSGQPIKGLYLVEPEGTVELGGSYGRIKVEGLTFQEAREAIATQLTKILKNPGVSIELVGWVPKWQHDDSRKAPYKIEPPDLLRIEVTGTLPGEPVTGVHVVQPDGTVNLGPRQGQVKVSGLTLAEATAAVENRLRERLRSPWVLLTLAGWENDWYDLRKGNGLPPEEGPLAPARNTAQGPYRVRPFDVLRIAAPNVNAAFPLTPLESVYLVEPDGTINLGRFFGRTGKVVGSTLKEAAEVIKKQLRKRMRDPEILVSLAGRLLFGDREVVFEEPFRIQPMQPLSIAGINYPDGSISELYVVDQYGVVDLGDPYGKVNVGGLTFAKAAEAVAEKVKAWAKKLHAREEGARPKSNVDNFMTWAEHPQIEVTWYGIRRGEWQNLWREVREDGTPQSPAGRGKKPALRYGGKTFEQWRTELMTELKPEVRIDGIKALRILGANGYGAEAAATLIEVMKGYSPRSPEKDDQAVFQAALDAIVKIGAAAVPHLREALKDDSANARSFAAIALGKLGGTARPALPALLAAMRDREASVRDDAIQAIRAIDPKTPGYLDALIQALKDEDVRVRIDAAASLCTLGPAAAKAVPMLVEALKDKDADVRGTAAGALTAIGPAAGAAGAALANALGDPDLEVRRGAIAALRAVQPKAEVVVPALIEALKDQNAEVRHGAMDLLGKLGAEAKAAVPALIEALNNPDDWANAIPALGNMGPAAQDAVPVLKKIVELAGLRVSGRGARSVDAAQLASQALSKIQPKSPK